jgi:hypothetical protein
MNMAVLLAANILRAEANHKKPIEAKNPLLQLQHGPPFPGPVEIGSLRLPKTQWSAMTTSSSCAQPDRAIHLSSENMIAYEQDQRHSNPRRRSSGEGPKG